MSIYKPRKGFDKKNLIDEALKDLDPSLREEARRLLEELDENKLMDREYVKKMLRRKLPNQ